MTNEEKYQLAVYKQKYGNVTCDPKKKDTEEIAHYKSLLLMKKINNFEPNLEKACISTNFLSPGKKSPLKIIKKSRS